MKWIDQPFPSSGLVYPKTEEKLPFMTWDEIERRVKAGGDADELWECLYLNIAQVAGLLAFVKTKQRTRLGLSNDSHGRPYRRRGPR